jgi:hypothetical protein
MLQKEMYYRKKMLTTFVFFRGHICRASEDDIVIDKIPMNEVEMVREMRSIQNEKRSSDAEELMIETHPDGYNSGRIYYLQAESRVICQKLIQKLRQYSIAARERLNAQTTMAKAQQYVGKLYRSKIFQNFVAILIIAVCIESQLNCSYICWINFA